MRAEASSYAQLWVWEKMRGDLPWYYAVSTNSMPAKYLICQRIETNLDIHSAGEGELWDEHARLTEEFLSKWSAIRRGEMKLPDLPRGGVSLLDLSVELTKRMLAHCSFCRWNCRVDRFEGKRHGACQLDSTSRVDSFFHHQGEEIVLRGTRGSGTIFFTSCNMKCAFCQNSDISRDKDKGIAVTPGLLALMAWQLGMEGCHNINWVGGEPTIHLHNIVEAMSMLREVRQDPSALKYISNVKNDFRHFTSVGGNHLYGGALNVPMLWNSNFFMSPEAMRVLRCLVDIWLPDFKFGPGRCAVTLAKTPWYWETVSRNHALVYDWGEDVVVRHLIVPKHVECCTKPVLDWMSKNMPGTPINIMDQFHPDSFCDTSSPSFDRRYIEIAGFPTHEEILESYRYAKELGLNFETLSYEKNTTGLML